ncbi:hypothetical protein I7I48_10759 [Histoplasma ohiense]|nr:hypothetical protein I7I48_10759 [Histoplasma ohiense (nom. inval.)]
MQGTLWIRPPQVVPIGYGIVAEILMRECQGGVVGGRRSRKQFCFGDPNLTWTLQERRGGGWTAQCSP